MSNLKGLAKDTAIYGLSSIIGRFINWLLVPLYTTVLAAASGDYGIVTEVYSYTALLLVILTFGMETTFFRFINKTENDPMRVYATTLLAVGGVGAVFVAIVMAFSGQITAFLHYGNHTEYVQMMALCVAVDAFLCIPFAYLRYQKKAIKFAALKLFNIALNIVLNLVFFLLLPRVVEGFGIHVGYVFAINLFCTLVTVPLLWKELTGFRWTFDRTLMRSMWRYAWPILVLGIAGILNQTADKLIFRHLVPGNEGKVQLGIYGACVKIAMIMAMITQAFRYAYEPFVFGKSKESDDTDNRQTYAKAMKYFIIFTLLAFLVVVGYLDILKYIIPSDYWAGLRVVPIVMAAEIMMGIYFNLSFWYKLIDRTIWGAWFSGAGCLVLIAVNILFVPRYGYMACAWAGVAGYATAMLLSYFVGQQKFPIAYPLKSITAYVLIAALFTAVMLCLPAAWPVWLRLGVNTALILLFLGHIVYYDFPLHQLPVVGRYFKKRN
jgi:O-antigen/teichoic acid export membrane protein